VSAVTTSSADRTAPLPAPPRPQPPPDPRARLRWDRVTIGLLVAAAGAGWMLDQLGVGVPWRMAPAAALAVVGLALLLSLAGGRGRGLLVALGVVLLLLATAVGIGAERFAGPVGDRSVVVGPADASGGTRIAAGTLTVDLTRAAPPAGSRYEAAVGAGRLVLRLPEDVPVRVDSSVVVGTITVDGAVVGEGVDVRWSDDMGPAAATVRLDVGVGEIEVRHAR
jgi:hypothetical protein